MLYCGYCSLLDYLLFIYARFRAVRVSLVGNGAVCTCLCVSFQSADENGDNSGCDLETSLEERIEELLHRLRIEAAVVAGAKNVIRILQNNKVHDKKALQEVSIRFERYSGHFLPCLLFFFLFCIMAVVPQNVNLFVKCIRCSVVRVVDSEVLLILHFSFRVSVMCMRVCARETFLPLRS